MKSLFQTHPLALAAGLFLVACSSSSSSPTTAEPTGFAIASSSGVLTAVAGDSLKLSVVQTLSDGTTSPLPAGATVVWSGPPHVTALDPSSMAASPLPAPGKDPSAIWIDNPGRADRDADLAGVLFVIDAGMTGGAPVSVTATISGTTTGKATASIPVSPGPTGDAAQGATVYGASCAACHGATAHGTDVNADGTTYAIDMQSYSFPAPGLNTEMGNVGSDPAWNGVLLAFSSRSDVDNGGLTLRAPMPDWLAELNATTGAPLTTKDFADIYAWLKTQSH